jgi:cytosine/adenosine deaminase-related metal-dependent hydrolase
VLTAAIVQFIDEAGGRIMPGQARGKAGRAHSALPYLVNILPEAAAYLTLRYALDGAACVRPINNHIGNFVEGMEADFVVFNPRGTPLLARL